MDAEGFASSRRPACVTSRDAAELRPSETPPLPCMLVRDPEKARPLNYLHDSVCEAEVLPALLSCFAFVKRDPSQRGFGSLHRCSPLGQQLQTRLYGSRAVRSWPDSGGCSLGKAPLSLPVLVKTAIAGCEAALASQTQVVPGVADAVDLGTLL